jgi:hypothetical protein
MRRKFEELSEYMYLKMSVLVPVVMGWDWDQCLGSSSENSFQVGAGTPLIIEIILIFCFYRTNCRCENNPKVEVFLS